jgi:outer membrane protein TolC
MKNIINIALIISTISYANTELLSNIKSKEIQLKDKKIKYESNKLKYDFIPPINATYQSTKDDSSGVLTKSKLYSISINQPIFKSGGIYYSIKYANAYKEYQRNILDIEKRELLTTVLTTIIELKKLDLQIQKQKLLLKNAKIDIVKKKEQFLEGALDSSFLDNALLVKNSNHIALISLYESKESLLKNLQDISDIEYTKVKIPKANIPIKEQYLKDNVLLKASTANIKEKKYQKLKSLSDELPTLSVGATYTKLLDTNTTPTDSQKYTMSLSMPIDINSYNRVEIKRVEYLQSRLNHQSTKDELINQYNNIIKNIELINSKIELSNINYRLYESLIKSSQERVNSGIITTHDLTILQNSMKIKEIEKNIYKLDKKSKLIELNSMI